MNFEWFVSECLATFCCDAFFYIVFDLEMYFENENKHGYEFHF